MLKRKTPLKAKAGFKRRRRKKMSELTKKQQDARRAKWAFEKKLKEVDALSRELAWLTWGNHCDWPLCKTTGHDVQWHHFISRDVWSVRWDPDNLIPLHAGCHKWGAHGKHSHYCYDLQISRLGKERFESLMRKKNMMNVKRNMETLIETECYLKNEITRISNSL